ncbi:DUF3299 domain-containing protein [Roseibium alexandrii]|uniref:DUF3299 domain-containing protein n=1 Tax=Roseibium alexandrii TaxID=388408 RepID=UPI0037514BAF
MTRLAIPALAGAFVLALAHPGIAEIQGQFRDRVSGIHGKPLALPFIRPMTTALRAAPAGSAARNLISWNDLRPGPKPLETPFASLSPPLLEAMRTHVRWRTSPKKNRSDEAFIAEHEKAEALLAENKVDVEGLMRERRKIIAQNNRAGRGANPAILGKPIRLPGYVVPIAVADDKVTEFLFVPVAGACVHTPTPPPNQIVRVTYPDGLSFSSIFSTFLVEGELSAEDTQNDVNFYDGTATGVQASYALNATTVGSISR